MMKVTKRNLGNIGLIASNCEIPSLDENEENEMSTLSDGISCRIQAEGNKVKMAENV